MQKKILAGLCCLLLSSFVSGLEECLKGLTVEQCGVLQSNRIVGGIEVKPGEYPWMVSIHQHIGKRFKHACGAALLNENWIVTAAHCVEADPRPEMYRAVVGLNKQSMLRDSSVQRITISEIVVHENFTFSDFENDIALLKTLRPMDFAESDGLLNGICLPESDEDPTGNAMVAGWGLTEEEGNFSDVLRHVSVPIVPRSQCNEAYDDDPDDDFDFIVDTMICAGKKNKDSCQNDSGGPLTQIGSDGSITLVGIVSFGNGCGTDDPGIYTKVAAYVPWMCDVTSQ